MSNTIHPTTLPLDAVACLLMAKAASRMEREGREMFWETLPDRIPDVEAHLPALIFAVRNESNGEVIDRLSSHPLPATLSPKAVGWRAGLSAAWEERFKKRGDGFALRGDGFALQGFALQGLMQVDRCGLPPGETSPSVLPILLEKARRARARFMCPGTPSWEVCAQLECLAALSAWRPGPNVIPDPAVLNAWRDFWLELYQQEARRVGEKQPGDFIILKGIAAKALLNLMETNGKEAPGLPAGMASLLLESLMRAFEVEATGPDSYSFQDIYHPSWLIRWLSWQPRDVTRFHPDTLAKLPKSLLQKFRFSCDKIYRCYFEHCRFTGTPYARRWGEQRLMDMRGEMKYVTNPLLTELVKWDRAGVLAACGVNLLPAVVDELGYYLDMLHDNNDLGYEYPLINHEVCRWLVRPEMANAKEGKELLRKLERYWIIECRSSRYRNHAVSVAWNGRIQLQRTGLATEDPDTFQKALMEAVKHESSREIQMVLSIWKPGEDTPIRRRRAWERRWQEKLNSKPWYGDSSIGAAMALLQPDATNNLIGQREELLDTLTLLPESVRLQLSLAEVTHLTGELPPGSPNAAPGAAPNRVWQFRPDDMRFRLPTEPAAPASAPTTVQPAHPDKMTQSIVDGVQFGGHH